MPTIQPLHPEYASSKKAYSSGQASQEAARSKDTANSTENKTPKSKSAHSNSEGRFFVGIFQDLLKTITRGLSGSVPPSVIRGVLKDSHPTLDEVIHTTCLDDLFSRFLCDFTNTVSVRLFNGKTKILGIKLPKLLPEISSQLFATQAVTFARMCTSGYNLNRKSAERNQSPEEAKIEAEISKKSIVRWTAWMTERFTKYCKPGIDAIFKFCLGVQDGEVIKDSEGNPIVLKDAEGKALLDKKTGEEKLLRTEPKVNHKHFWGVTVGSFIASMFLPKDTQQAGFEDTKGPLRALFNVLYTTFWRINTSVISSGAGGMHTEGKNFDACFENSTREKSFIPLVQHACDGFAAVISRYVPFFNGFTIATALRVISEIPTSFLSAGSLNLAKNTRVSKEWDHLCKKVFLPTVEVMEKISRPAIEFLSKHLYWRLPIPIIGESGIFDPKIPRMYGYDNTLDAKKRQAEKEQREIEKEQEKQRPASEKITDHLNTAGLLLKQCMQTPKEIMNIWEVMKEHGEERRVQIEKTKAEAEEKILERKLEAEKPQVAQEIEIKDSRKSGALLAQAA